MLPFKGKKKIKKLLHFVHYYNMCIKVAFVFTFQVFFLFQCVCCLVIESVCVMFRCGMIYMEPHQLGWTPLKDSYMNTLPETLADEHRTLVRCC